MTDDDTFISMGKLRALSRQMLRIDYRTKDGVLLYEQGKFSFVKNKTEPKFVGTVPSSSDQAFFSVTSLGKNIILVNGTRISQGDSIRLESGDAIKVSCYMLYFLLPTEASTKTMQFGSSTPKKKAVATSSTKKRPVPSTVVSTAMPTVVTKKKKTTATQGGGTTGAKSWAAIQAELDGMSTDQLMEEFLEAIDNDDGWNRRSQTISHLLAHHGLLACAADPRMQQADASMDGVLRTDIMKWMEDSDVFGVWAKKVATKVENKTYTANITKALLKAGYERTTNSGRYIRWKLPEIGNGDVSPSVGGMPTKSEKGAASSHGEENEDDDDDDDDAVCDSGRGNDEPGEDASDGGEEHADEGDDDDGGDAEAEE